MKIETYGSDVLRQTATPVEKITPELCNVLDEMVGLMNASDGVGLAAPQVGISERFIVIKEVYERGEDGIIHKMLNPKITKYSEETVLLDEGCLSVLNNDDKPIFSRLVRPSSVSVEWMDENGEKHTGDFSGFPARILQHEIDHLDGVLFIDKLGTLKRDNVIRKIKK